MDDISRRGFLASMLVLGGGAALARKLPAARLGEVVQPVLPRPTPVATPTRGMALRRVTAYANSGHGTIGVIRNGNAVMAATFDRHLDSHLLNPLVVQPSDVMQIAYRDMDATDLVVNLVFEEGWSSHHCSVLTVPGQVHGTGTFRPLIPHVGDLSFWVRQV